ncbi:MAG: site-specific integrase [Planctomycetes bacterium]|uniref:tyrosine-type recombinase/integrase n=1 Tax=Candidatus Wunengus californicus TaxID=3367619 RepID=UPI0040295638|nr:site-specific integrase [Planctomycetota bacterium]
MAVRFRKYFKECKPVQCTGRRSRQCHETPKRSNGEYKTCGTWCIEFFDDNKQWQSLTFKDIRNKTDAEKRLTLFISDRERGQLNLPKKKNIPTLAEYSKTYLEHYKTAKENTFAAKKRAVNVLVEYLGDYRLDKITPFVIEKYRIDRKGKDKVKDGTINDDNMVLGHVFTTAIKAGIIGDNPCKDVKRLKVTQVKDRILSQAEIALLLDELQGKDRLMVLVGLFTGLRLGGVLSLSWNDIDFTSGIITSSHKTGKLVSIPMSEYLKNELQGYRKHSTDDMIFETRALTHVVIVEHSTHFSALFKSLGIHNFTFHNLRHTFSSILQGELGIGAVVVQGMTGHSSLSMLQKYSHTGLDNKQKAIQALTDHVLNTSQKTCLAIAQ